MTELASNYQDPKRYAWLLSLLVPLVVGFGPALMLVTANPILIWVSPLLVYVVAPLLDWVLGEDRSNPPETAVPQLDGDLYYRWVTYALIPILWAAFVFGAWIFMKVALPAHAVFALILTVGFVGGFCINLGHELGHKNTSLERWLAKIILAPTAYGHFFIEHNRGHHRDAATPADPASSRTGESIYRFVWREMPGALKRAWSLESDRLKRCEQPLWSLHNEILQPALITLLLWTVLGLWLGWAVIPFLIAVSFWANFQLTSANYVEHYGLLRKERAPGRYEICQPHHSWNSNHVFSNWALFHLQRHSDHHAHPLRRYQALRHVENLPSLPSGYFGMFMVAYVPPLWFKMMDRRLLAVVQNDPGLINFDPAHRNKLVKKFGLTASVSANI